MKPYSPDFIRQGRELGVSLSLFASIYDAQAILFLIGISLSLLAPIYDAQAIQPQCIYDCSEKLSRIAGQ
jgi:hypothetical protein